MKGWGPKTSVCPSKAREIKLFGGMSRDFARDIPWVPEKFEKENKKCFFGWESLGERRENAIFLAFFVCFSYCLVLRVLFIL